jgi:hypothetical protein
MTHYVFLLFCLQLAKSGNNDNDSDTNSGSSGEDGRASKGRSNSRDSSNNSSNSNVKPVEDLPEDAFGVPLTALAALNAAGLTPAQVCMSLCVVFLV